MKILGIESSCDETAASVVEDGRKVLSSVVFSQADIHSPFNGVVPEIASRNHALKILGVIEKAIGDGGLSEVDAIAVTEGPGLIGALLVGISTAKSLAFSLRLPIIAVNHILAHAYAPHLTNEIPFPYIALVVSGGHTLLYRVDGFQQMTRIGSTIDDACGEAYDKVSKMLGLGYPGGKIVDDMAARGDENFLDLPRGLRDDERDRYNFSYSGIKTAVAFRLKKKGIELPIQNPTESKTVWDVCASFQKTAIDLLLRKTKNAVTDTKINRVVISGGVAANSRLRAELAKWRGVETYMAALPYCGDNAAMVAGRAFVDFQANRISDFSLDAFSRLSALKKGKRAPRKKH